MTWSEFKALMHQRGVTDDTPICTIWYEPGCDDIELAFHGGGAVDVAGVHVSERPQ